MSELDRKTSWRLWLIAATCAIVLHAGGIAAAVYEMQKDMDDDGLGSDVMEIGLDVASPDVEQTDLPQGPDSEAAAASPAVQEQKAVEKESDLPQEIPLESENPDRAVTEKKVEKPKEETQEEAKKQQEASLESAASEAAARQKIEDSKIADKPRADNPGIGGDKKRLSKLWEKRLSAYIEKNKQYPDVKKFKNLTVKINFTLDRMGKVLSVGVVEGSGDPIYDEAAVSILKRAKNIPAPPPELADETLSYVLDIRFAEKKT